eukprot:4052546-Amphidinium_carterae.1
MSLQLPNFMANQITTLQCTNCAYRAKDGLAQHGSVTISVLHLPLTNLQFFESTFGRIVPQSSPQEFPDYLFGHVELQGAGWGSRGAGSKLGASGWQRGC